MAIMTDLIVQLRRYGIGTPTYEIIERRAIADRMNAAIEEFKVVQSEECLAELTSTTARAVRLLGQEKEVA